MHPDGPVPTASAHVDTFCRDNLPPADQWPELLFDLPELAYPDRLNCAVELLDGGSRRTARTGRACLAPDGRAGRTASC